MAQKQAAKLRQSILLDHSSLLVQVFISLTSVVAVKFSVHGSFESLARWLQAPQLCVCLCLPERRMLGVASKPRRSFWKR